MTITLCMSVKLALQKLMRMPDTKKKQKRHSMIVSKHLMEEMVKLAVECHWLRLYLVLSRLKQEQQAWCPILQRKQWQEVLMVSQMQCSVSQLLLDKNRNTLVLSEWCLKPFKWRNRFWRLKSVKISHIYITNLLWPTKVTMTLTMQSNVSKSK